MLVNTFKTLYGLPNFLWVLLMVCGGLFISSCNQQARGFALPEGDIEKGKATYRSLSCNECHTISGIAWKGGSDTLKIPLGGETKTQKSYGELVTSVINPSHKIAWSYKEIAAAQGGGSKMVNYNDVMTVQELVDLVTFLQSEYHIETPPTHYYPYHY